MKLLLFYLGFMLTISLVHFAYEEDEWSEPEGQCIEILKR